VMYDIRDYWVFGLCLSSGILKAVKEHNVSETSPVSVLRWETSTLLSPLGLALSNATNRVGVSHPLT
jgi:hypothetical protein